jgi:hypothetical protein
MSSGRIEDVSSKGFRTSSPCSSPGREKGEAVPVGEEGRAESADQRREAAEKVARSPPALKRIGLSAGDR